MNDVRSDCSRGPAGRRTRYALRHWIWLVLLLTAAGGAQNPWPQRHSLGPGGDSDNPVNHAEVEKRLRLLNAERQKQLVSDTDKLLKLAGELEAEANRSDSAVPPSADEMAKVAEIEKLAKSVKDKMKLCVRVMPVFDEPMIAPPGN